MASIIDTSFFFNELEVAQIGTPAVQSSLQWYIEKYEREYLMAILGYDLWKLYTNNPGTQIYKDILDGKEFVDWYGQSTNWQGLKYAVQVGPPIKYSSPIANFVYCKYMKDQATATTGTGEKVLQAQNAIDATAWMKITRAWNDMVDQNRTLYKFLRANNLVYPSWESYRNLRHNFRFNNLFSKTNPIA